MDSETKAQGHVFILLECLQGVQGEKQHSVWQIHRNGNTEAPGYTLPDF